MKIIFPVLIALIGIGACQKGFFSPKKKETVITLKQSEGEPLAQIGDSTLTVEELKADFLERQGTFKGAPHLNTDKKRDEYIESQVVQEALFLEAVSQGYFNDPEVRRNVKKIVVQHFMRKKLMEAQKTYVPTDEDIKDYYDKNPAYFNHEESVKIAYLAIPNKDKNKAKQVAEKLLEEAAKTVKNSDTREFARLAIKHAQNNKGQGNYSIEANETGFLEKDAFEAKFGKDTYNVVSSIETLGNIGPLLASDGSYFVFMKTGQRKKLNESLEEAKPKIAKRLAFEKRGQIYESYLAEIKNKYKVKVFQDKVAALSTGAESEALAADSGKAQAAAGAPGNAAQIPPGPGGGQGAPSPTPSEVKVQN